MYYITILDFANGSVDQYNLRSNRSTITLKTGKLKILKNL